MKKKRIVIHCSAGPVMQRAAAIVAYHLAPVSKGGRGWKHAGYHYIIEADGNIVAAVPEHLVANGARGYNSDSLHICYTGGIGEDGRPADTRTPAQRRAMKSLVADLLERHPYVTDICGHRDLSPDLDGDGKISPREWIKACPCFDVRKEFEKPRP